MHAFQRIPPELFYQIALHLPLTRDVLAFRLTNTLVRDALSTSVLFKARLVLRGWDVSAWNDEDDAARSPGDFERWTRIDHNFCRTAQLFDEATVEDYFLMTATPSSTGLSEVVVSGLAVTWLQKLSGVLPLFVTHHRGGNISRITEAKYLNALRAYAAVVDNFCTAFGVVLRPDSIPESMPMTTSSQRSWFEPICFSLIALLMQCDAATIVSIFTDNCEATILSQNSSFSAFDTHFAMFPDSSIPELVSKHITERYSAVFFFQTVLLAALHRLDRDSARLGVRQPLLPAPSLPHFDPRSSSLYYSHSYQGDDASVGPGAIATAFPGPVRPWLHDGLAGTPLAALSSTTGCAWAGYYTYKGVGGRDPPMYIELRSTPAPDAGPDTESARNGLHFRGEGHDGVGKFVIHGACDTRTGMVGATKVYEMHQWEWRGMLTPFGMAGMWGPSWGAGWGAGWWWIWPREWSPVTTRHV